MKTNQKRFKFFLNFTLRSKGQHRIGIMNIHIFNALSHGATPMCIIHGKPMSEQKKIAQTDGETYRVIPIYPLLPEGIMITEL